MGDLANHMEQNQTELKLSDKALYDYNLVQRALKNDQLAYGELLDRYRESIYYMVFKMVKDREDAEDLTIEAFGKAFKRLDQYTPNFAFSTWFFKIATNNCIDFIRKKRMQTYSLDDKLKDNEGGEMQVDIKDYKLNPEEEFIKEQKKNTMRNVVDKLKPRYRRLVELRYFEEYSYEEIAEEMQLPIGTVKAQLFRAREFLLQVLESKKDQI